MQRAFENTWGMLMEFFTPPVSSSFDSHIAPNGKSWDDLINSKNDVWRVEFEKLNSTELELTLSSLNCKKELVEKLEIEKYTIDSNIMGFFFSQMMSIRFEKERIYKQRAHAKKEEKKQEDVKKVDNLSGDDNTDKKEKSLFYYSYQKRT